jgi:micrococcal nuclease
MRKKLAFLTLVVTLGAIAVTIPVLAFASPGGLDRRGGHHCWTKCASRGYYAGQYHCHRSPCNRSDVRQHRRHGH